MHASVYLGHDPAKSFSWSINSDLILPRRFQFEITSNAFLNLPQITLLTKQNAIQLLESFHSYTSNYNEIDSSFSHKYTMIWTLQYPRKQRTQTTCVVKS